MTFVNSITQNIMIIFLLSLQALIDSYGKIVKNFRMKFTHKVMFFDSLYVTPVGDRTGGICSIDTPVMNMSADSCTT